MTMLLLIILVLAAASLALRHELRRDGYGSRPPPRSRYDEIDPRLHPR